MNRDELIFAVFAALVVVLVLMSLDLWIGMLICFVTGIIRLATSKDTDDYQ